MSWEKRKLKKVNLTFTQAYVCLKTQGKKGDTVHTFRDGGFTLIGADWSTKKLVETMKQYESTLQLTGRGARGIGHGIALFDDMGALFIETIEKEVVEIEKSL